MSNIGYATMQVIPSLKGTQAKITGELGGLAKSGDSVGQNIGSRLGGGIRKTLSRGVLAVGAAAGGALGTALFKGFGRLTKVEAATAKLTGLGHSAKSVKSIMDNALESVKGTAFGLDEAASTAAGAVASGVKPGKELTRTLKLVGDAATIGGSSMSEMGSIFNKVAASGKLQGDVIAQLGDRGIPILQLLGKELGKTPAEVAKLASKGKVDFATFQKAMEQGLGGAALKSGDTFKGALANMQAALGRVGAKLLGGIFPQMKNVFGDATKALDNLGPVAEKVGEALGKAFAWGYDKVKAIMDAVGALFALFRGGDFTGDIGKKLGISDDSAVVGVILSIRDAVVDLWSGLSMGAATRGEFAGQMEGLVAVGARVREAFDKIKAVFSGGLGNINLSALGGLGAVLGVVASKASFLMPFIKGLVPHISKLATVFRFLTGPVGIILGLFATLYATNSQFRDSINGLLSVVGGLVAELASALAPILTQLATTLMPILSDLFAGLAPILTSVLSALVPMVSQIAGVLVPVLTQIISAVLPVFNLLLASLVPIILQLAQSILPPFLQVIGLIAPLITALLPVVASLVSALASALMPVIRALLPVVQMVFTNVQKVITAALTIVQGVIKTVTSLIKGDWSGVWNGIKQIFSGVWEAIKAVVSSALSIVKSVISAAWGKVKETFASAWDGLKKTVSDGAGKVVQFMKELPGKILSGLGNLGTLLVGAGKNIVEGLWEGIKSLGGWIKDKVVGFIASVIPGPIREALGIASPSKVTKAFGRWVAIGLAEGMLGSASQVKAAANKLASNISAPLARRVKDEVASLKKLAGQRESVAKRLKDAQKKVADALKTRDDYAASIRESFANFGKITDTGGVDSTGIIAVLQRDLATAKDFASNLAALKKMGISNAAYQQIVDAGVEQGGKTAAALVGGGKAAVSQVNSLVSQIAGAGSAVAKQASSALYQAGVDSAAGLVKGLTSQSKALEGAAKKIANSLTAQVKKALGIRSPSRVFAGIGENIGQGLIVGMGATQGGVDAAVRGLVGVPRVSSPSSVSAAVGQPAAGGDLRLSDFDIQRLASAISGVQVRGEIAPSAFDRAMGAGVA